MPVLIKIEPGLESTDTKESALEDETRLIELIRQKSATVAASSRACNETFDIISAANEIAPALNETVTIAQATLNSTVTLIQNPHDSLMTEDLDDDVPMEEVPPSLPKKKLLPLPAPMKLKKNEVFK